MTVILENCGTYVKYINANINRDAPVRKGYACVFNMFPPSGRGR